MKKKRSGGKTKISRKMKKTNLNKSKKIKGIIRVIFIVIICSALFFIFEHFMKVNKEFISSSSIEYYIKIVDECSKPNQQLNWKEIASIYGAKNGGDLNKHKDESVKNIADKFWGESDTNNKFIMKTFEEVLDEEALDKAEERAARKNLEKLENISKRSKSDDEQNKFIQKIKEPAINMYKKYGILPSVTVGQAILESNWGKSELSSKYNNYFGIKSNKSWKGKVANFSTKENHKDVIKADFRVYDSLEDSVNDLGNFLTVNTRYGKNGVFTAVNYLQQAEALEKAGYSTIKNADGDSIYADLVINLIRDNNLMLLDWEVQNK